MNKKHISSEYSEDCAYIGKEYRVKTSSEIVTVSFTAPLQRPEGDTSIKAVFNNSPKKNAERDSFEIVCIGHMEKNENGEITLSYDERLDDDAPEVPTTLTFSSAEPNKVTLTRCGTVNASLYFEEGNFKSCRYVTPIMPIAVSVYTRRIENGITEHGGVMKLDYAMEIPGSLTQRVMMTVEVTEL